MMAEMTDEMMELMMGQMKVVMRAYMMAVRMGQMKVVRMA